jgi:RimJ/RimL family protein N-acetyltransferase
VTEHHHHGDFAVAYYEHLNNTPALALAMKGWADVEERGLGDGTLSVYADSHAFVGYARNGRDLLPAGVITFSEEKNAGRLWIHQGYVVPEFRGRGLYSTLWCKLVEHAVKLRASTIMSATHVRNEAMRAVARRQGRVEAAVMLRYDLQA